jgi:sugar-specific transcriptional regulator TrmB
MKRHLQEIGFTNGEEKVYLALLKLGSSSTGVISKESGVSRSKLYEILEKLTKKGVVSHFKKNNRMVFRAAPPDRIVEYLDTKKKKIEEQKEYVKNNMPFFEGLIAEREVMKEAEVFEGMEGIKNVRETALNVMEPGEVMYYFGPSMSGHKHVLGYWDDWNKRRVDKKIKAQIVYNQDAKDFGERRKKLPFTKVKYLPVKGKTHAWIEIYRDTVVIVIKHKTPMSIVVNNKFIAESFRTYFSVMWEFGFDSIK